jgi:5-methylcytosine-specific restriction protein A
MATYLLTWNPNRFAWDDLSDLVKECRQQGRAKDRHSTGNTKKIQPGDRLFLLRQSVEPRGISGSGVASSVVFEDDHWDPVLAAAGNLALFVELLYDILVDPATEPGAVLPMDALETGFLEKTNWATQSSGIQIEDKAADQLERLWSEAATITPPNLTSFTYYL